MKKSFLAVFSLLFIFSFVEISSQTNEENPASTETQSQQISVSSDPSSVSLFGEEEDSLSDQIPSGPSGIFVFIRMIIVLAIVCGLIYVVLRFVKKSTGSVETNDQFLRRLSSISLGAGKSVQVVSLMDKAYILGVTDTQINLIAPVEDEELIQAMNLNADKTQNRSRPRTFADVLELFMPGGPRNESNQNIFSSDRENAVEEFERTRNRLNESSAEEEQ